MKNAFRKLFAPFAIFAMSLGLSLTNGNSLTTVGAKAVGEETGAVSKYNSTSFTTAIADGPLTFGTGNNHIKLVGGSASFTVTFAKNSSSTTSIFNNSAGEIRLYGGSGNGGQLTFAIASGFYMKEVTVTTSQNGGYKINDSATITDLVKTTTITNQTSFVLKNVAASTGQVRISSVSIVYKDSQYVEQTFGTLTALSIEHSSVKKTFVVGDTFTSSGLVSTALDQVNFEKNVSTLVDIDYDGVTFNESHIGTREVTVSYTEGAITVSQQYSITVIELRLFVKVTSPTQLHFGARYLIANEDGTKAMSITQNANNRGEFVTSKVGSDIKFEGDIQEFSLGIGKVADTYAFKAVNGTQVDKFISSSSSSSNNLISSSTLDANGSWLITISSDTVISSQGSYTRNHLRYNSTSYIFSSYASDSTVVGKVSLYVFEDSIDSALSAQMFASEVNTGLGSSAFGTCQATFTLLDSVYNRLSVDSKNIVDLSSETSFVNARARMAYLEAWIASQPSSPGLQPDMTTSAPYKSSTFGSILLIGIIGLTSVAGYYFLKRKGQVN